MRNGRKGGISRALDAALFEGTILWRGLLGSTVVGEGVAVPHARFQNLGKSVGLLAWLEKAIDYDAIDGKPVDLVCGASGHLRCNACNAGARDIYAGD